MKEILCVPRRTKRWSHPWLLVSAILIAQLTVVLSHTILEEYSCGQEDIEYGVTLRGGTNAGIFQDRGQVRSMQECMRLCCETKSCDVAMMHGPKCFSIRCLNDSVCESMPADDEDIDMQVAHLTTKGSGQFTKALLNDTIDKYDPESKCPHNQIMYNVKLRAGLKAGKFTDIGKVKSIKTCIRYCCESKAQSCDLAFMLSDRCYLVKCYSEERCQALPAPSIDFNFNQKMAFVAPWLYEKGKKVVKIPSGQSPHHLQCIQSKLYKTSQLLDGQNAGDFTDVGRIAKPHICTQLCCQEPSCDLAYMFGKTCFLVKCNSEKSCRVIPDEEATNSPATFKRSVQYIVRRKFGVRLNDDGTPVMKTESGKDETCRLDGEIRNKTVLMAGMLSGKLTHHKGIQDITSCVKKCCGQDKCHVAMMMAGNCYSVFCTDTNYCQPKPAPKETHHTNPTVAYVKRGEISLAPKLEPIMPLIERFHPNIEQAVEEEYVEDDAESGDEENKDEDNKQETSTGKNKAGADKAEGSGAYQGESDQSGSGVASGEDGRNESDQRQDDNQEGKHSEEKASGESGEEERVQSGDGETEDSGEGDEEEEGQDEHQAMPQLKSRAELQGVLNTKHEEHS